MRRRRAILLFILGSGSLLFFGASLPSLIEQSITPVEPQQQPLLSQATPAISALDTLPIKGRAAKTGYQRAEFGNGWSSTQGCSTRNIILNRDLRDVILTDECVVASGVLDDPYSAATIQFTKEFSAAVQIDHVVALSDAWQKGAQQLTKERRIELANDPLELLAVEGAANQQKSDSDAASWLPKNKAFRCAYVARQIAVKQKYELWVTQAEYDVMKDVLQGCPAEAIPSE